MALLQSLPLSIKSVILVDNADVISQKHNHYSMVTGKVFCLGITAVSPFYHTWLADNFEQHMAAQQPPTTTTGEDCI